MAVIDIDKLIAKAADEHVIVQGREPALKRLFLELSTEEPSVADPTTTSSGPLIPAEATTSSEIAVEATQELTDTNPPNGIQTESEAK